MAMSGPGWGTWDPEHPATLLHVESGLRLTPVLYSACGNRATALPPGDEIIYGERSIDGATIRFETRCHGTRIAWCWTLGETITLDWTVIEHGEWGLRFWITLAVSGPFRTHVVHDRSNGQSRAETPSGAAIEVKADRAPLLVTAHESIDGLIREFEEKGYFYLGSRAEAGHLLALRYNLDEAPENRIEITGLPQEVNPATPTNPALQAVHDVIAWNHVYDTVNHRPVTIATRNWNARKFGGFGLWMTDTLYNALMWSLFDSAKARHNLDALFAWQTEAGNLPCLVTGNDRWLDRSQPPVASAIVEAIAANTGDDAFTADFYPALLRNHDWWWSHRTLADTGFLAWGTSLDAGDGLYKGTKLAAKNESSMDNLPVHDDAPFNTETGLLESADVGLNSLIALDGEVLARMATARGDTATVKRLKERTSALKARIQTRLWDPERGVFANRLLTGEFVSSIAPTSFWPMLCDAASETQIEAMITHWLIPEQKFGGRCPLPCVTRDDPAYPDNVYWRGRIWAPHVYWTVVGLARAGRHRDARSLADAGWTMFEAGWQNRQCGENYNAETGEILDQADTDPFYAWGGLFPALKVMLARGNLPGLAKGDQA